MPPKLQSAAALRAAFNTKPEGPSGVIITLEYPPSANRYWRMVSGRMLVSREARLYKVKAAETAFRAGMRV